MKRKRARPVFKEYTLGQIVLLPTNIAELIPANHLVRVVNDFVERMDLSALEARYKGGGTSSYHPKMMLKVFLFAYAQMIFSSRRIAKALRENLLFMWLSGNQQPNFRTINYFRGRILKGLIEDIFQALLLLLVENGYIKLEEYFVDGTKLEANANRYTFVWAKNTQRFHQQLTEKVAALFEQIEQLNAAEDARYGEGDLEEVGEKGPIDLEKLSQQVQALNERLKAQTQTCADPADPERAGEEPSPEDEQAAAGAEAVQAQAQTSPDPCRPELPVDEPIPGQAQTVTGTETAPAQTQAGAEVSDPQPPLLSEVIDQLLRKVQQVLAEIPHHKALKKAAKLLEEDYLPRARKYERQQGLLCGRNSYSKTDPDATFMRMKEDHMRNGQLKPAYNVQIGTEAQFVVGFSLHQEVGDATCFIPHMEQTKQQLGRLPGKVSADAAYGSEENYAYLEREQVGNYLKYNTFDREQKPRYKPNPFKAENMPYDPQRDEFTCPNGKKLVHRWTEHPKTKNGYRTEREVYECEDCQGCLLKAQCTQAALNRQLKVNFQLWDYRQQARENLLSEEGKRLRSQRGVDVETVFGRIKQDWGFRRFLLRGLEKVTVEWGLLCIAHNLAKVWNAINEPKTVTA